MLWCGCDIDNDGVITSRNSILIKKEHYELVVVESRKLLNDNCAKFPVHTLTTAERIAIFIINE